MAGFSADLSAKFLATSGDPFIILAFMVAEGQGCVNHCDGIIPFFS